MIRLGSLCTGYGGIELGLAQTFSPVEMAWHADSDPGASKLLAYRYPTVPNLGDITVVDWAQVPPVDVIAAGWPCQPWSLAGRRKGANDERAIWPAIAGAIRTVRPSLVVLENVPAIAGAGELARACGDLASLGYVGSWRCVRASDVGAPHQRKRIFIVAVAADSGSEARQVRLRPKRSRSNRPARNRPGIGAGAVKAVAEWNGANAAHSKGDGLQGRPGPAGFQGRPDDECDGDTDWAEFGYAIERWAVILGRSAPAPTVLSRRGGPQLNPAFVEWVMGLPAGWVTAVPGLSRTQQLKLLGNGVVPRQCAVAVESLLAVLDTTGIAA